MASKNMEETWKQKRVMMLWAAGALRFLLVVYSEWQDAHLEVPYTDIDYYVFSDAASLVTQGKSPFERSTYRYTPLLAFILLPNSWIHRCWGKLLFSTTGFEAQRGVSEQQCAVCVATWLFNPFTFAVGTRGNCEALVCAAIPWLLVCLLTGHLFQAAVWFGLVVHVRIYPIIYALPILVLLDDNYAHMLEKDEPPKLPRSRFLQSLYQVINWKRVVFGAVSGGVFLALCGLCYYIYGVAYLQESLFYHLTRSDHRHNFSIYFYSIYLQQDGMGISVLEKLVTFLPQLTAQLVLILSFAKDLPFCLFVQTFAFVAFNKVITAQYFVWFFCLLPLILPSTTLKLRWKGVGIMAAWTAAQLHWLAWAYMLEFRGKNVFLCLWTASLTFFTANIFVLSAIIAHHSVLPCFLKGKVVQLGCNADRWKEE